MAVVKPQTPIINWNNPIAKGLVLDIPFFEGSGNKATELVSNQISTLTNGPTWTKGIPGYGVAMQGSDDFVNVTTKSQANQLSKYSIQLIVTRKSKGITGGDGGLFFKSNGTTKYFDVENNNGDGGWGIVFVSYWSGGAVRVWSINYPTNDTIQNWIITYDHSTNTTTPKWYVNGVDTALNDRFNNSNSTPQTDGSTLHIGNNEQNTPTNAWDGNIFLARLWNRILIPTEARSLYANPWQIYLSTSKYFSVEPSAAEPDYVYNAQRMLMGMGL